MLPPFWCPRRLALLSAVLAAFSLRASPPDLPPSVDLRPRLKNFGLTPRRQGDRNTCSVFTMTGAIEFAIAARQGRCPRLSPEFLNWAANQACERTNDGGFFSDMWKGFAAHGICAESNYPYESAFHPSTHPWPEAVADAQTRLDLGLRLHWIKEWDVKTGLSDSQLTAIKSTLNQGWPVTGGFRWPKRQEFKDNILQMCPPDQVFDGHSVLLVGYLDDASLPGGGVFLFRNTSPPWDHSLMPYAYARVEMNDAAWVDFDPRPNPRR